jgi:two-component system KDP operon response regulator KdpE
VTDSKARILVVDDEPAIRRLLRVSLTANGYSVDEAGTGEETVQRAPSVRPDLILLDIGLPGISGVEVTRCLREWTETPIIVLSVRDQEADKIAALDAGADDYLTKPFTTGELLARIRSALRRSTKHATGPTFSAGDLAVDLASREVLVGGDRVQLTVTEYELLKMFVTHAGKVLTHQQLARAVWGHLSYKDQQHVLRVHISNLRHKLERDPSRPQHIVTESGVGYRLESS